MDTQAVALIQVLIPTVIAAIFFIYHQVVHKLPAKEQDAIVRQRGALETFVPHAVQMVEQISDPNTSGREKKMIAMSTLKVILAHFEVPVPNDEILSALIESTVYAVNQQVQGVAPPSQEAPMIKVPGGAQ